MTGHLLELGDVSARSGLTVQRERVLFGPGDEEIDRQASCEAHAAAPFASFDRVGHQSKAREVIDHGGGFAGGDDEVDVGDDLLAPAQGSGHFDGDDARRVRDVTDELIRHGERFVQEMASGLFGREPSNAREDGLLGLDPEAADPRQTEHRPEPKRRRFRSPRRHGGERRRFGSVCLRQRLRPGGFQR